MKTSPPKLSPMLAILVDAPFDSTEYVFELKFDGYRVLASIDRGEVLLYSRNLKAFNDRFPSVVGTLEPIKENVLLDGEIVAYDRKGVISFQFLQNSMQDDVRIEYVIFDLLFLNNKTVIDLPLLERKELLQKLLVKYPELTYSHHIEEKGKALFEHAKKIGMEGIVAKKKTGVYLPGKRSELWLKVKHHMTDEAIIAGYTEPRGSRTYFGALVLGQYRDNGELGFVGHTGTGFDSASLQTLYTKMKPLQTEKSPFKTKIPLNAPITWIRPELVAELKFSEWTESGVMRQPVFLGLREDKPKDSVKKEKMKSTRKIITK